MWSVRTIENYLVIKRNEVLIRATTQVMLKNTVLSEGSQLHFKLGNWIVNYISIRLFFKKMAQKLHVCTVAGEPKNREEREEGT